MNSTQFNLNSKFDKFAKCLFIICSIALIAVIFYFLFSFKGVNNTKKQLKMEEKINYSGSRKSFDLSQLNAIDLDVIGKVKSWHIKEDILIIEFEEVDTIQQLMFFDLKKGLIVANFRFKTSKKSQEDR
jgi:hypothetical protein